MYKIQKEVGHPVAAWPNLSSLALPLRTQSCTTETHPSGSPRQSYLPQCTARNTFNRWGENAAPVTPETLISN